MVAPSGERLLLNSTRKVRRASRWPGPASRSEVKKPGIARPGPGVKRAQPSRKTTKATHRAGLFPWSERTSSPLYCRESLRTIEHAFDRGHDLVHTREDEVFQILRVRHGDVLPRHPHNRCVEIVKSTAGNTVGDLSPGPGERPPFFDDDTAVGPLHRTQDQCVIERPDRARVNHFDLDAVLGQLGRRLE